VIDSSGENEDLREEAMEAWTALAHEPAAFAAELAGRAEGSDLARVRVVAARALGPLGRAAQAALPLLDRLAGDRDELLAAGARYSAQQIRSGVATTTANRPAPPRPEVEARPARRGDPAAAMARLRAADHEFTEDGFYRALHDRDARAVADFLEAGMSATDPGTSGMPPLHLLLMGGCDHGQPTAREVIEVVADLLSHGADPNALDEQGNPALHRASSCDGAVVRALVAGGADMQKKNAADITAFPIFLATNPSGAEALLDAGFTFDAQEAAQYREWARTETDAAKKRLLQRAGAR
jgi:hypothetical protein